MTPDILIVIIAGLAAIAFTYWFFLMKEDREVEAGEIVDIVVEGGYSPSTITVKRGRPVEINFLRKDPNSCLEEVVLSEFKIKKFLPLNEKVSVEITPQKTGEFPFSCGMNMYHGKLIVRE